jgi:hypothetical protein
MTDLTDNFLRDPKRPGSPAAREKGCICPSNNSGLGEPPEWFSVDDTCPLHWEMAYYDN